MLKRKGGHCSIINLFIMEEGFAKLEIRCAMNVLSIPNVNTIKITNKWSKNDN